MEPRNSIPFINPEAATRTPRKTRTRAPKADRLLTQAAKRVNRALKAIRLVGGLANYGPTPLQISEIIDILSAEIVTLSGAISMAPTKPTQFSLST